MKLNIKSTNNLVLILTMLTIGLSLLGYYFYSSYIKSSPEQLSKDILINYKELSKLSEFSGSQDYKNITDTEYLSIFKKVKENLNYWDKQINSDSNKYSKLELPQNHSPLKS
jgi:hypothetical protein